MPNAIKWYALLKCDSGALQLYPKADTIKEAKSFLRNYLGVKRLPNKTEVWRSND